MGEVILVASGKGGTGKTAVTANLGALLAKKGAKVALIDMDMWIFIWVLKTGLFTTLWTCFPGSAGSNGR